MTTNPDIVGAMRHRIEIIQLVKGTESDYGGEQLSSSSTYATLWAAWETKESGSGEQVSAGQKDQVNTVNWRVRYDSSLLITTEMLIKYENLYYDILSVLPDSHRAYVTIESRQRGEGFNQTVT